MGANAGCVSGAAVRMKVRYGVRVETLVSGNPCVTRANDVILMYGVASNAGSRGSAAVQQLDETYRP